MRGRAPFDRTVAPGAASGERRLVLAVADSPLARQLVATFLAKETDLSVVTAFDWAHAQERLQAARPDVVALCSERLWPDDPGARVFHERRIPIVLGTVDLRTADVQEGLVTLLARVREAPRRPPPESGNVPLSLPPPSRRTAFAATPKIVAIGASAGGTMALKMILPAMPADAPAIIVVQHMSGAFTGPFAEGLNRMSAMRVREAEPGDVLEPGAAVIAPGDRHAWVERRGGEYVVELAAGPLVSRHRPSVNVLFRSVAQCAGPNGVGVVLTGMGDDGADGMFEMKELGAATIAQNEATSVVFGMPRAAILRGGVGRVVALNEVPGAILEATGRKRSARL